MRILGLDPGYAIVGVGLVEYDGSRFRLLDCGVIRTPAGRRLEERLLMIYSDLRRILEERRPDAVSVEQLYFAGNATTGIAVAEARGVLLLAAEQSGIPVYSYSPLQVKSAVTGYGRAEKRQVMEMTRRLLRLKTVPRPDDAADALALAICHGHNGMSRLPSASLRETKGGRRGPRRAVRGERKTP